MKKILWCLMAVGAVSIAGCNNRTEEKTDDELFEEYVGKGQIEETAPIVSSYLSGLNIEDGESAVIDSLTEWMERKPGVTAVERICVSCIKTTPAQSALKVSFLVSGDTVKYLMDVSMGQWLLFKGYHKIAQTTDNEFIGKQWSLKYTANKDMTDVKNYIPDEEQEPYIMLFNNNGLVEFPYFCNMPVSNFLYCEDGRIMFYGSIFRLRRMTCPMFPQDFETIVIENFTKTGTYAVKDGRLTIYSAEDKIIVLEQLSQ